MELKAILKIKGSTNKSNVVEALINSGYIVSAEIKEDYLGRILHWEIHVYEKNEKQS